MTRLRYMEFVFGGVYVFVTKQSPTHLFKPFINQYSTLFNQPPNIIFVSCETKFVYM